MLDIHNYIEYNIHILNIGGVFMFCPKCGKDVGESKFCPECGTPASNSDVSPEVILRYLGLRFSNLRAMSFQSAKYFLLHWEAIRMLWNEAALLRQKAPTLSAPQVVREKQRLQNLCATLGCDNTSIQYASEIVAYAFSTGK